MIIYDVNICHTTLNSADINNISGIPFRKTICECSVHVTPRDKFILAFLCYAPSSLRLHFQQSLISKRHNIQNGLRTQDLAPSSLVEPSWNSAFQSSSRSWTKTYQLTISYSIILPRGSSDSLIRSVREMVICCTQGKVSIHHPSFGMYRLML
jgi:hypothetical protein